MKAAALIFLLAGLALAVLLVLDHGAAGIWHSARSLGAGGFALIVLLHLSLYAAMGSAWFLLGRGRPDARLWRFVWARIIRDSAAETLPLSQIGGYVIGARALTLTGIDSAFAAASTVVDVSAELVAQLAYTMLGLVLLIILRPRNPFAWPTLGGLCVMAALAAIFIAVQARGAGFVERAGRRLAAQFLGGTMGNTSAVQTDIHALHARPWVALRACAVHLLCWVASGLEGWITLRLLHIPISLAGALVIDSLLYGLRSAAFLVPNALGVQEGALLLLGAMFGIGADAALALSLIKRARDIAIGIPALLVWQGVEGGRVMRGKKALLF